MTEAAPPGPIVYPETDGRPMPDGEYQSITWRYVLDALKAHYRGRGVYAAGDLFVYLEEGNPRNCIAPDLFVVLGASDHKRDTYKVWEEPGGMPDFVLEIVSPSTWRTDLGAKRARYACARRQRILAARSPRPLPATRARRVPAGRRSLRAARSRVSGRGDGPSASDVLGLELLLDGERLRFFDPVRERFLPTYDEAEAGIADRGAGRPASAVSCR